MGALKIIALIGVVTLIACDPGPLPAVPERDPDSRQDRFPSESYDPLPLDVAIQRSTLEDVRRAYDEVNFEMISRAQFPDLRTRDAKSLEWVSSNEGSPYDNSLWRETPITPISG